VEASVVTILVLPVIHVFTTLWTRNFRDNVRQFSPVRFRWFCIGFTFWNPLRFSARISSVLLFLHLSIVPRICSHV